MKIKRLASFVALFAVTTVAFTVFSSASASAATCEWTGGRVNNWWNTVEDNKSNWTCNSQEGHIPANGDSLVFKSGTVATYNNMALAPGESYASVRLGVDGESYTFNLSGDQIRTNQLVLGAPGQGKTGLINSPAAISFNVAGGSVKSVNLPSGVSAHLQEVYTEVGVTKLEFTGSGHIWIGSSNSETSLISAGRTSLEFKDSVFATLEGKTVRWNNGTTVNDAVESLTMLGSAVAYVSDDAWFGDSNFMRGSSQLRLPAGLTVSKALKLEGDNVSILGMPANGGDNSSPVIFSGWVDVTGGSVQYDSINEFIDLRLTGSISGKKITPKKGSSGSVIVSGSNTSETPNGRTAPEVLITETSADVAAAEEVWGYNTLVLNHERTSVTVHKLGLLKGNGRVLSGLNVLAGGTVAPGLSPGNLTVGSLSLAGDYEAEIQNDTFPGGYDRITVSGGAVTLSAGSKLNVKLLPGANIKKGNEFLIISNLGSNPVSGTFDGLAEGATVTVGEAQFRITYLYNGNNIALIALNDSVVPSEETPSVPGTPNTGVSLLMTNPLVTLMGTIASAGTLFVMARKYNF